MAAPKKMAFEDLYEEIYGDGRRAPYWTALGMFLEEYSAVELFITLCLYDLAGVPHGVGRIIFSGTRVDLASTWIRKLAVAKGVQPARRRMLFRSLDQLSIITKARNDILHYGPDDPGGERTESVVISSVHAFPRGRGRRFPMSPRHLWAMTVDVNLISSTLLLFRKNPVLPNSLGVVRSLADMHRQPWLYKPPKPRKRRRKPRRTPPGPPLRPRPSQA